MATTESRLPGTGNIERGRAAAQSPINGTVSWTWRDNRGNDMKLKSEIDIDAPVEVVWAAFDSPDNTGRWMRNLDSITTTSGEPGQPGTITELVFDENGREVILKQTVTERRAPDFLAVTFETPGGSMLVVNHFEALGDHRTRWSSWCNFNFTGLMKFFAIFMRGSIRRREEADMQRFKLMVESDLAEKNE